MLSFLAIYWLFNIRFISALCFREPLHHVYGNKRKYSGKIPELPVFSSC